jgi:hypothetical protein
MKENSYLAKWGNESFAFTSNIEFNPPSSRGIESNDSFIFNAKLQDQIPEVAWDEEKFVEMDIYKLIVVNHKIQEKRLGKVKVYAKRKRLTLPKYEEEAEKVLKDIPVEFHEFLKQYAWEEGHSSGYEEVLSKLKDLQYQIVPCIRNYTKNIFSKEPA